MQLYICKSKFQRLAKPPYTNEKITSVTKKIDNEKTICPAFSVLLFRMQFKFT